MIVTVPNTGTRSLRIHLNNTSLHHFCRNEHRWLEKTEPISTTVRDPIETCVSWHDRHGDLWIDMFGCMERQIEVCSSWKHGVQFYETAKLPVHDSKGEPSEWKDALANRDLDKLMQLEYVQQLMAWIKIKQQREFYRAMLGKLWWQK